jgi:hypothetical protein
MEFAVVNKEESILSAKINRTSLFWWWQVLK